MGRLLTPTHLQSPWVHCATPNSGRSLMRAFRLLSSLQWTAEQLSTELLKMMLKAFLGPEFALTQLTFHSSVPQAQAL
jgi:hypothetical protein